MVVAQSLKFSTSSLSSLSQVRRRFLKNPQTRTSDHFSQFQNPTKLLESQLVSALDVCTDFSSVKQVHARILRHGLDQSSYVLAKLLRVLNNVRVPVDSYGRIVFEQVANPNPFLWTALIRGYSTQGLLEESVSLYNSMRRKGTSPVSFTFTALLKACGGGSVPDVNLGMQVHAQMIFIGGFASDLYVGNTLIDMYVELGLLDSARQVFNEMPERDVISWTELIVAYTKSGDMSSAVELFSGLPDKDMVAWTAMVTGFAQNAKPKEAIQFFERMQNAGIRVDKVTLVGVISACAQLGTAKYADWIRGVAETSGFDHARDVVLGSALIDMYSKCGSIESACTVFESVEEKNVFSYSSMIAGYAAHGLPHAALKLFNQMLKTEIIPNDVTFIGVLTACSHAGMVEQGRRIFSSMPEIFCVCPSVDHYTCMVDLLGRSGQLTEALEVAETMPMKPSAGVWGALLGACRVHKNPDIAEVAANHLFEIEPYRIGNYILLSNLYASAGRFDDVSRIRRVIREKGLRKNPACSWVEAEKGVIHEFFAAEMTHLRSGEIMKVLEDLVDRLKGYGYQPHLDSMTCDLMDEDKKRVLLTHSEKLALGFGLISSGPGCGIRIMKNVRICEDCHSFMCGASGITKREIIVRDGMRFHHFRDGNCSCGNFW